MTNKTKGRLFMVAGGPIGLGGALSLGFGLMNMVHEKPYALLATGAVLMPFGLVLTFYGQHKWKFPGPLSFPIMAAYAMMIVVGNLSCGHSSIVILTTA